MSKLRIPDESLPLQNDYSLNLLWLVRHVTIPEKRLGFQALEEKILEPARTNRYDFSMITSTTLEGRTEFKLE